MVELDGILKGFLLSGLAQGHRRTVPPPITDNMLPGEGNSTPHGALIGKCASIVKWNELKKELAVLPKRPPQNLT